jgi:hypothetical protein
MTSGIVHKSPLPPGMTFFEALERYIRASPRKLKYPKRPKRKKPRRRVTEP